VTGGEAGYASISTEPGTPTSRYPAKRLHDIYNPSTPGRGGPVSGIHAETSCDPLF